MAIASLTIASLEVDAVMSTASAPMPPVQAAAAHGGVGRNDLLGAQLGRQRAPLGRWLDAEYLTAGRAQQLDRDQPEQAEADDDHPLAERRLGAPDALQRDRAERREGRVAQRHAVGHRGDEVGGHRHDLCVAGAAGARAGDVLAGRKSAMPPVWSTKPAHE